MTNNTNLALTGRKAVVTGGSKGIGRSIALTLAQAGADVAISARNLPQLDAVAEEIRALGRRSLAITCDVTDPEQVQRMATQAGEGLGGVDILVNNAGAAGSHKFLGHPDRLWHHLLAMNLTSVYYVTKAIAPLMVERKWGRIINIASTASKVGAHYIAAYSASKHGVLGLTRTLAVELMRYNITVNAICPGYVDTPMTEATVANIATQTKMAAAEARKALENTNPQGRLIEPEEVAAVVLMLAQDVSKGISGQAINVDGGMVMW
jgi:NAD(P)-dependent dehydrogenase (short-subunit alcohol dehydrogenase family)